MAGSFGFGNFVVVRAGASDRVTVRMSPHPCGERATMPDDAPARAKSSYRPYVPSKFRARSHDTAHDTAHDPGHDAGAKDQGPRVSHPMVTHDPPAWVDTAAGLAELVGHCRAAGRFAYDSEFIGELTYLPKLCLVQVATAERVALVDPLAGVDLRPFWELVADPAVEKVVHAGQQDIEPVHRHTGRAAANVFDTQISAGFVGLAYPVALSKLVAETVGGRLGKGLTFTRWDQRPLSAMQLRYAADDVRYLIAVRDVLGGELDRLGHAEWARAECAAACDPAGFGFDPATSYHKVRGGSGLPPRNQAVLRELTIWRDGRARAADVPPRAFLKDEVLLDLARQPLKSTEKMDRVRGLPRPVQQDHGGEIVEATARGLAAPVDRLPAGPDAEPTPRQRFAADSLWAAIGCVAAGRSIDPALVTSRQEAGEVYRAIAAGRAEPADARLLRGWRREAVGQTVLDLFAGKTSLQVRWDGELRTRVG